MPDNQNWLAVMDAFASEDDPRDTFSQSGYLSAKFFVETLLEMDPAALDDRAAVTEAIKGIVGKTSDLICGPYYVGEADRHMPNHAGIMVVVKDSGFEVVPGLLRIRRSLLRSDHRRRRGPRPALEPFPFRWNRLNDQKVRPNNELERETDRT